MSEITLGVKAKDKITGFEGVVTGTCQWLTGCDQVCIKPLKVTKDNGLPEGHWFDVGQVQYVGPGLTKEDVKSPETGGPQSDAPQA